MIGEGEVEAMSEALWAAENKREAIAPLKARWPEMDIDDAYRVQLRTIERRVEQGATIRGHKVGLSSRVMQQMMGVHEPDFGHLLDDMFVFEDAVVAANEMIQPRVEVEVAFVLGEPLPTQHCTAADVIRATEFILPAIEIIDSRIADWKIGIEDTIADNASSARVVLGGNPKSLLDCDVRKIGATLRVDHEIVATGTAAAVLGNPVTSVAWLAQTVGRFGVQLDRGHVILPGSCTAAATVRPGSRVHAEFDELGHVAVAFD